MKRLLTLTLFALLVISCTQRSSHFYKGSSMTYSVGTQADLDAANQRVKEFKQELLQQGFHEVSVSFSDTTANTSIVDEKEEVVLEGQYGTLKELRVNLWSSKWLQKDKPHLGGGVYADVVNDQADREFETLYKKICFVVTGSAQ